jgi:hypothetical protein
MFFCYLVLTSFPYFVASIQYEMLWPNQQLNKYDVEKKLFFYTAKEIPITDSSWGKTYKMKQGESCWQYNILWTEPIDIVYDENQKVVTIFASFE